MISRVRNISSNMHKRYQDGAAVSHEQGTSDRICIQGIRSGCRLSRVGNYRSYMPTRYQEVISGSHGFETPARTCICSVRTVLHDFAGSERKVVHDYNVSGWGFRISRIRNNCSNMHTRYQNGAEGSHG